MNETRGKGLSLLGLGAAACAACCAGPVLAFLGGLSLAGLASTVPIGAGGLAITVTALVTFVVVQRRRAANACAVDANDPVAVPSPTRKVR